LQKIDSTKIFCITGSAGELGSGGNAVVRLASAGAFGYVAVKCFSVHGGDAAKWKIQKKYAQYLWFLKFSVKCSSAITVLSEVIALNTACFCYLIGGVVLPIFQLPFNRSRLASITIIYAMSRIFC